MKDIMNKTLGEIADSVNLYGYKMSDTSDPEKIISESNKYEEEYTKISKDVMSIFAQYELTIPEITHIMSLIMTRIISQNPVTGKISHTIGDNQ